MSNHLRLAANLLSCQNFIITKNNNGVTTNIFIFDRLNLFGELSMYALGSEPKFFHTPKSIADRSQPNENNASNTGGEEGARVMWYNERA